MKRTVVALTGVLTFHAAIAEARVTRLLVARVDSPVPSRCTPENR
jgi:hypothetical protein